MLLNAADKAFLREMIPHHKMAVKMAETVIRDGSDMRVDALARKIRDGQGKEIAEMEAWLKSSGEKPSDGMGHGA